jgi:hypothetical protein
MGENDCKGKRGSIEGKEQWQRGKNNGRRECTM